MTPLIVLTTILGYFALLYLLSFFTSRKTDSMTFFTAGRKSPWYLVAYGMLGVSISGITFISVPGEVGNSQFSYLQVAIGYSLGLVVVALIFLPLYYRLRVVSIYTWLEKRFGFYSYKTGAAFFMLAQTFMAAFRLFLMAGVLQLAVFDAFGIPFEVTTLVTLLLIWLYTYRGGIKTVVITDLLQTTFLVAAVVLSIAVIGRELDINLPDMLVKIRQHPDSKAFFREWSHSRNFFKLVFTGMFITLMTNGIDQAIMQKHLTCPNLRQSQKNMFALAGLLLAVNLLFLGLGSLLYIYARSRNIPIPAKTDDLYPLLALRHFDVGTGLMFILGISAAAYSSADSSLTGLTTSFCIDFLNFDNHGRGATRVRTLVHLGFSLLLYLVILGFRRLNDDSVVNAFIRIAGYVYGPLLGLYLFGLFTRIHVRDRYVPLLCLAVPVLSVLLYFYSKKLLWGYQLDFEMLVFSTALTFLGLLGLKKRKQA